MSVTNSTHLIDLKATQAFANKLANELRVGDVVFLYGNLGAGKTTLTRFILRAMGYAGIVKSPTYSIVETYDVAAGQINHFDLYRIEQLDDLDAMGFRDFFSERAICIIEWPERLSGGVRPTWEIHLRADVANENARMVETVGRLEKG